LLGQLGNVAVAQSHLTSSTRVALSEEARAMELAHEMVVAQHAKLLKMNVPTSKDAEKIEPEYQMEDLKNLEETLGTSHVVQGGSVRHQRGFSLSSLSYRFNVSQCRSPSSHPCVMFVFCALAR
jgi:hypothetical protein